MIMTLVQEKYHTAGSYPKREWLADKPSPNTISLLDY
jgi:hypothetical protein